MAIHLIDDGTLDTVLRCSECGEEFRFNYDPDIDQTERAAASQVKAYAAWVSDCIAEVKAEHECPDGPGYEPYDDR